jgi:hypothetical protein
MLNGEKILITIKARYPALVLTDESAQDSTSKPGLPIWSCILR